MLLGTIKHSQQSASELAAFQGCEKLHFNASLEVLKEKKDSMETFRVIVALLTILSCENVYFLMMECTLGRRMGTNGRGGSERHYSFGNHNDKPVLALKGTIVCNMKTGALTNSNKKRDGEKRKEVEAQSVWFVDFLIAFIYYLKPSRICQDYNI